MYCYCEPPRCQKGLGTAKAPRRQECFCTKNVFLASWRLGGSIKSFLAVFASWRFIALLMAAALTACATTPLRGTGDLGVVIERASGSVLIVDTTHMSTLARVEGWAISRMPRWCIRATNVMPTCSVATAV